MNECMGMLSNERVNNPTENRATEAQKRKWLSTISHISNRAGDLNPLLLDSKFNVFLLDPVASQAAQVLKLRPWVCKRQGF